MKYDSVYFGRQLRYVPEYRAYSGILARCTNPKNQAYKDYGARGITVCDRWL